MWGVPLQHALSTTQLAARPGLLSTACCRRLPSVMVSPLPVQAKKNPCKGKKDGALVAKGKCSAAYYQCWEGKPVSPNPECASPLVFNPKAKPQGCS